jgi:hypothetical protein
VYLAAVGVEGHEAHRARAHGHALGYQERGVCEAGVACGGEIGGPMAVLFVNRLKYVAHLVHASATGRREHLSAVRRLHELLLPQAQPVHLPTTRAVSEEEKKAT